MSDETVIPGRDNRPKDQAVVEQPRAERYAAGRHLRRRLKRRSHAAWRPADGRADPTEILRAQGRHRIQDLLPLRYERMGVSPLSFLRGAAAVMAADLAGTPTVGLMVQSCGDCHLANFGSYATPEEVLVFDINDFDETLPAPFEWDVKRLATSLVLSGRENGFRERDCRALARDAVRAYAQEVARLALLPPIEAWSMRIDLLDAIERMKDHNARQRARARLDAQLRSASAQFGLIDHDGPTLKLREKPPLVVRMPEHETTTRTAFARYVETLAPERRLLLSRYRLADVMFKVVGVGSVGTFCAIGLFVSPDGEPLMLQIKEAQPSVLEPFAGGSHYANAGERVVVGQRIMQAASDLFLGWTHTDGAAHGAQQGDAGRQFYVRRLKDSRLAALGTQIEQHGLRDYAVLCGRTLGRAHGRSADIACLAGYLGSGRRFSRAVGGFAVAYADQTDRDWRRFTQARAEHRL